MKVNRKENKKDFCQHLRDGGDKERSAETLQKHPEVGSKVGGYRSNRDSGGEGVYSGRGQVRLM